MLTDNETRQDLRDQVDKVPGDNTDEFRQIINAAKAILIQTKELNKICQSKEWLPDRFDIEEGDDSEIDEVIEECEYMLFLLSLSKGNRKLLDTTEQHMETDCRHLFKTELDTNKEG